MSRIPLCLMLLVVSLAGYGQYDTLRPMTAFSNPAMRDTVDLDEHVKLLRDIAFPSTEPDASNLLEALLYQRAMAGAWHPAERRLSSNDTIVLRHCVPYYLQKGPALPENVITDAKFQLKQLSIQQINLDPGNPLVLSFCTIENELDISDSKVANIYLYNCNAPTKITGNELEENFAIKSDLHATGGLEFKENTFDSASASIAAEGQSFTADVSISRNRYHDLEIEFRLDTFRSLVNINNQDDPDNMLNARVGDWHSFTLYFDNCYFDAPVYVAQNGPRANIIFRHCSFGPNASNIGLTADSVKFLQCANLPLTMALGLHANRDSCWLFLKQTSLAQTGFIYGPGLHLGFDKKEATPDDYTGNYETLLSKFKTEGKKDSYQRLDIEYHAFQAANGTRGARIFDWLNREWWNYGYSKGRVVQWTLLFLAIFFLGNALFWRQMQETYPIAQDHHYIDRSKHPVRYQLQKYLRIFLYTAYIFFSIKIDLPRLKVTHVGFLLYFFFQFLVGLWCLFFIVNALLKLNP